MDTLFHQGYSGLMTLSFRDFALRVWWSQGGSNSRPPACKAGALPAELWPLSPFLFLLFLPWLVGLGGLEPPTSPLSGVRSNHLSYRPERFSLRPSRGSAAAQICPFLYFLFNQAMVWTLKLRFGFALRKEVIQPQVPLRLPCYDFTPVMNHTVASALPKVRLPASGATHSHGVTGGVYKARERIHRGILIRDY